MDIRTPIESLPGYLETDGVKGDLPAVYVFTPDANATWVLWEYDAEHDAAYGMADLGPGNYPECGSVSVAELEELRGAFGLPVEVDKRLDTRFKGMNNRGIDIPDWMQE